jgi:hypothetical protein
MIFIVIHSNLWLAKIIFNDIDLIRLYFDFIGLLAYRGVKAPNSDQIWLTNFFDSIRFQSKNFFSSSFELNLMIIVNWNKLKFENFIFDHFHNYKLFRKNYGYRAKSIMTPKMLILYFPSMADVIILKSYGFIK